jgi:hypothetical protein
MWSEIQPMELISLAPTPMDCALPCAFSSDNALYAPSTEAERIEQIQFNETYFWQIAFDRKDWQRFIQYCPRFLKVFVH